MEQLNGAVEASLARYLRRDNPYFEALRSGAFERADFVETQVQFYFAVVFFSRPMAAVAAKIPQAARRLEVLRNVWEEHGEGDAGLTHGATFLEFLRRLDGLEPHDVDARALWPEVRAFNTALVGACVLDEYLVGVAVLGMIERMFADISQWIGSLVVERGFLQQDELVHYKLHAQLDVRHSADFFDVLAAPWAAGEGDRYAIRQGLELGGYLFDRLYRDLFAARARRLLREPAVRGLPHSRP